MDAVSLDPYSAERPSRYRAAAALRAALGGNLVAAHHVGSTAVAGLAAKPIVDILLVVGEIERVAGSEGAMRRLGYAPRGEYGVAGRYFVRKEGERSTHHVHVFEVGHPAVARPLAFRDYLRAHPEQAARYGRLKLELAEQFPHDKRACAAGEEALVAELQRRADRWLRGRGRRRGPGSPRSPWSSPGCCTGTRRSAAGP